jgi:hypothetical protein
VDCIHNSHRIWPLRRLLKDLLAWGNRPTYLIPTAYQWCFVISEKIREHGGESTLDFQHLLSHSLAIAFRHIGSSYISPTVQLSHSHHHEWMLDIIFTTENDDLIADAVCVWIVDREVTPPGSCTRRLLKLTERGRPFSPRLRCTIVRAVRHIWKWELEAAELELVYLLNDLEVSVDEMGGAVGAWSWVELLQTALCLPVGRELLSSHYWLLLGNLISMSPEPHSYKGRQTEVMKLLGEAQDWEKLETWMLVVWWSEAYHGPNQAQDIDRVTLTLFRQRPSAIPRFEYLCERRTQDTPLLHLHQDLFRWICDQARAEQSYLESPS